MTKAVTYRLYSSGAVWAPGILAVMIEAYQNKANRAYVRAIFRKTWNMPAKLADAVLTGKQPYTIDANDDVWITT